MSLFVDNIQWLNRKMLVYEFDVVLCGSVHLPKLHSVRKVHSSFQYVVQLYSHGFYDLAFSKAMFYATIWHIDRHFHTFRNAFIKFIWKMLPIACWMRIFPATEQEMSAVLFFILLLPPHQRILLMFIPSNFISAFLLQCDKVEMTPKKTNGSIGNGLQWMA